MITSPDAVYLIIPCIKELGMSWTDIKNTPRYELNGLIGALSNYNMLHAYDGYDANEINEMAKGKPALRSDYNKYLEINAVYRDRSGIERKELTFKGLI